MRVQRNEITTGLLFLGTMGVVVAVVLSLTAPGLFKPLNEYSIYFDSAAGINSGGPVMLAGRKIGQVVKIYSPVQESERPAGHADYEVRITVQVDKSAIIYANAKVSMEQLGMLGEQVIDFSGGSQSAGLATPGASFIGKRVPTLNDALPQMLNLIEPVAVKATATLQELQETADNLNQLTAKGSDLRVAVEQIKDLAENLRGLTGPDGPLSLALKNFEMITAPEGSIQRALGNIEQLTSDLIRNNDIPRALDNIRQASSRLDATLLDIKQLVRNISPTLSSTLTNAEQFTDTVKRQPWRLIWPTTKKYPEGTQDPPPGANITIRKQPKKPVSPKAKQ